VGYPRGADNPLGGNAAHIQAIAAQQLPLDERHPGPQSGGPGRTHQAGRAGADHHQVIAWSGLRIHPIGGMNVAHQGFVVYINR